MFAVIPRPKTRLQLEMDRLVLELGDMDPQSEEYGQVVDKLSALHKIEQEQKPSRVSPDNLTSAGAHILGIWMIIHHEELHPLTSKALSFVPKLR